jgi:hypothetical protein
MPRREALWAGGCCGVLHFKKFHTFYANLISLFKFLERIHSLLSPPIGRERIFSNSHFIVPKGKGTLLKL